MTPKAARTCTIPMACRAACRCGSMQTARKQAPCHARIFAPILDGRLLALDAATGKPCADFGEQGVVDLLKDIRSQYKQGDEWRNYLVTSPPAILDGKVIVGSSIGDNRAVLEELGTVRAFDARSGRLVWSWDPIPRDPSNPIYKEWDSATVGNASAANAWAPLSVDTERHLVFVPTGSASPDFFGGARPGDNRWANSIVALDGDTGKLKWGQQLVHHDIWDYDVGSQPTLANIMHDGKSVPAVIQATKTGFLFTFDRDTGTPLFPIVERAVPQDAVPGEHPSPTQPFPSAPPALVRQSKVTPDDAWGVAWFDTRACRKRIEAYRSEGIFQPPALKDSLMQPGNAGGSNWGGIAFDPQRQLAIANTMNLPFVVALIPRADVGRRVRLGRVQGLRVRAPAGHALRHAPQVIHVELWNPLRQAALGHAGRGRHAARRHQVADSLGRHAGHSFKPRHAGARRTHCHRGRHHLHRGKPR